MTHLFYQTNGQTDGVWNVFALAESPVALTGERPITASDARKLDRVEAALHKGANGAWLLFAPVNGEARVNGLQFPGVRLLRDRDEIRICNQTFFFSTERLASVKSYNGPANALCPRCRQEITSEMAAVQCPGCSVWHHENGGLNCWTYGGNCALCPQKTPLIDNFQWIPEAV